MFTKSSLLLTSSLAAIICTAAFAQEYPHAFPRQGTTQLFDNERVTAETARQALTDKEIALAVLDQALSEQWVALELASGALIGEAK